MPKVDVKPISNPATTVIGAESGLKNGAAAAIIASKAAAGSVPSVVGGRPMANPARQASVSGAVGLKAAKAAMGISAGPRLTMPSVTAVKPVVAAAITTVKPVVSIKPSVKPVAKPVANSVAKPVTKPTRRLPVTFGAKLPITGPYTIAVNGASVNFDVAPRVENGIPLTPFRHLFEHAGGEVKWNNLTKSLDAKGEGQEVYIRIGDKIAKVNSLPVELELAPFIERGRTVVPLSFIRESLNVDVEFDPATGHVLITSKKKS
jgi:hypothetical protein